MSRTRRLAGQRKSHRGFSIAEVLIAASLLVMFTAGMAGMLVSSSQLSQTSRLMKDAQRFARTVSENIKGLPFYQPWSGTPKDVDDFFWGTRNPITEGFWVDAPEVDYTAVTDPRFTATVKMVYLNDDLTETDMKSDTSPASSWWPGPDPKPASATTDKPTSSAGRVLHLLKYRVTVKWKINGMYVPGSTYGYTSILTDTQFMADLGITSIRVTNPARVGTLGDTSAPHVYSDVPVEINGYGFKTGMTITAALVKTGLADIQLTGLNRISDTRITAFANLSSGATGSPPWNPRRNPDRWTVKVAVGSAYAMGYDIFTVQFPRPTITGFSPLTGKDSQSECAIRVDGGNILNLGTAGASYPAYSGATIKLVKDDGSNIINPRADKAISYTGDSYGAGADSVTATFDLRGHAAGSYYVEVINCRDNRAPGRAGDVISVHSDTYRFTLVPVVPVPADLYVTGSGGGEVYVATGEKRHFAYRNRDYTYNMRITGTDLGAVSVAKLGLGGDPANGTSPTVCLTASSVTPSGDGTYVDVVFDLKGVADANARDDDTYPYWIYVENGTFPYAKGNLQNVFQVRKPRPILYKDAEYVSGPGGLYHNYHSVTARLTGECFNSSAYKVGYKSGDYSTDGGMANQTYYVGSTDGGMTPGTPGNNGTRWDTMLNLIHCRTGIRNIWVETNDATPVTDNGFTSTKETPNRTYTFYVNVVATDNASLNAQSTGAVTITNRFDDWWRDGPWYGRYWAEAWRGPTDNTESAGGVAQAQRTNTQWSGLLSHVEWGGARFKLRGQGFKDHIVGTNTVDIAWWYTDGWGGWWWSGLWSDNTLYVLNPTTRAAADTDRTNKYVTTEKTGEHQMPNAPGWPANTNWYGQIKLGANEYPNRFFINQVLTNKNNT